MRKIIEKCPACEGEMIVTEMRCTRCETVVQGRFQPNIFSRLSADNLRFLEMFVKSRGNVKDMERELGLSYWTIRNRLNEMIAELGFETPHEAPPAHSRRDVLRQLNEGQIGVDEAAELLKQLQEGGR